MKKIFNILESVFTGIIFIVVGSLFIINSTNMYELTFKAAGLAIIASVLIKMAIYFIRKRKVPFKILDILLNIIVGSWLIINPKLFMFFSGLIFGLYALLQAMLGFIELYIRNVDRLKGRIYILITSFGTLIFALLLLYSPIRNSFYFCYLIGFYLIFFGIMNIISLMSRFRIPLPIIFTMFYPQVLMNKITNENNFNHTSDKKPDLEILIHLAKNGSASMGHVEIGFENKIYSYACYNYFNRRLFGGIGDGIVGIFDHDAYIKYCVNERERFIISYGFKLSENDKKKIRKSIDSFVHEDTEKWYPGEALYDNNLGEKAPFTEMANGLYRHSSGIFYRFTKGKYKTFFVCRTNCVTGMLAMLSPIFTKLIPLEGIITPGTYYKYLDDEYKKPGSKVISKTLYTSEVITKLGYKYKKKIQEKIDI